MKEFALINCKVVTHKEIFEGEVRVRAGKIVEVKKERGTRGRLSIGKRVATIDLSGKYLLPGLIDAHVHFRTPGMTEKEDWTTGSRAALAGGVTTVLDMPNTIPPTTTAALLQKKRQLVAKKALVNYGFYVGATGRNLAGLKKIKNIAGAKIFMGSSTGDLLIKDKKTLEQFMAESGKTGQLLAIHAELEDCIARHFEMHKNERSSGAHSRIRAPECAYEAVKEVLHLAKKHGARVHICHISTEKELELVHKFRGRNVSTEVTPHHLFLTDRDYLHYENLVKVNPPLRGLIDQAALWEGLKTGLIEMVASDHAPHLLAEKEQPYLKVPSGVPGVQTMLPLLLNAVNEGKLSLPKIVEITSYNPAKVFGIEAKGQIAQGFDADFAVVDLGLIESVSQHHLWSKTKWSPFLDWVLKGWPVMTMVGGEIMYKWQDTFGKKPGREIHYVS